MKSGLFKNIFFAILLILATHFIYTNIKSEEKEIHYHAGFVVFDNGQKVDFSDLKYMNIEPCALHKTNDTETPEHSQTEKAHLHDGIGDVVHVHRTDSKWGDLFINIKYGVDYASASAYINGSKVEDVKDYPIKAYDSLVLFLGKVDESLLSQAVTVDHIKTTESKSETCGN